jgi:hypothetical protein
VDPRRDGPIATIDGHFVAALDETPAEFLGKCLETTIVGGNSAGAQDRDSHPLMVTVPPSAP